MQPYPIPIPLDALKLSRKVDECEPLPEGSGGVGAGAVLRGLSGARHGWDAPGLVTCHGSQGCHMGVNRGVTGVSWGCHGGVTSVAYENIGMSEGCTGVSKGCPL
jgi:hypothetical protein